MQNPPAVTMIAASASTVLLSYGVVMVMWTHAPIPYVAVIMLPALAIILTLTVDYSVRMRQVYTSILENWSIVPNDFK